MTKKQLIDKVNKGEVSLAELGQQIFETFFLNSPLKGIFTIRQNNLSFIITYQEQFSNRLYWTINMNLHSNHFLFIFEQYYKQFEVICCDIVKKYGELHYALNKNIVIARNEV